MEREIMDVTNIYGGGNGIKNLTSTNGGRNEMRRDTMGIGVVVDNATSTPVPFHYHPRILYQLLPTSSTSLNP